jgi:hypothetical protein
VPAQFWEACTNSPSEGAGTALSNSTTLTDIGPAPQYVVPANYAYQGQRWKISGYGIYSTTGTPTLTLGVYWGGVAGTAIGVTTTMTTASGAASFPWRLEFDLNVRTIGSSGTVWGNGYVLLGASLTAYGAASGSATVYTLPASQTQPVTINTTTANAWSIGAQWGTANSSNTVTCEDLIVELLN